MRGRLGGSWKRRWHPKGPLRELGRAIVVLGALFVALFMAGRVHAQGAPAAAKPAVALSIERCERSPFDVDAYERVLAIELRVLAGQPADASSERQLTVRSPSCNDELEVSLRMGERSSSELLRASDYAGVGQPRALALATIETLRVLTARLQGAPAPAELPAPDPALPASPTELPAANSEPPAVATEPPAAPAAEQPAPIEPPAAPAPVESAPPVEQSEQAEQAEPSEREPAREPGSIELYAGVGAGLFDTLDWQVELGGAFALTRTWWIETELAFGQASDESALGSIDASALTLAASLEARLRVAGPFELSFGAGLRGGAAWASADSALSLRAGAQAQEAIAPVLLAFVELGATYEVADGLVIGLWVEPGLGIEVARFLGPPPTAFDTEAALSQRQPEVDLLGHGIYGGLTLGYRF